MNRFRFFRLQGFKLLTVISRFQQVVKFFQVLLQRRIIGGYFKLTECGFDRDRSADCILDIMARAAGWIIAVSTHMGASSRHPGTVG
jgi:hypothetical protein